MTTNVAASFQYHAPSSVEEACRLLAKYKGGAKLLAGGHSLLPLVKLRLATPEALIDLSRIKGLSYVKAGRKGLAIGAMTTYYDIESSDVVKKAAPVLADAAAQVADTQVRNAGTLGGSLAHSDPAGDLPAVVLALGAELEVHTARGSRTISVDNFFRDLLTTALRPNEVLTEIRIPPLPARTGTAYVKLANKASHYAVVGVAAVVTLDKAGVCAAARVAVTGAGPHAVRAKRTERILIGKKLSALVIRRAAERAGAEIGDGFNSDIHASAEYRAAMTIVFAERALTEAVGRV
ncbi:MAG: xanthine dehydrogenase family protein subunit M [Dehalococcoidia bacterium]|nr:xanthine dehydrogenase family protein subunit M [Dehalococcoidia bacterium]MSQ34603.1 xanthine dehydrogenase family protein subunit M [Dehalococcoidia bacterium]